MLRALAGSLLLVVLSAVAGGGVGGGTQIAGTHVVNMPSGFNWLLNGSFTASIAPGTTSLTASISGTTMTVTAGTPIIGGAISGSSVTGTPIVLGTQSTAGNYTISVSQGSISSETITESYGVMTVSAVSSGTVNQQAVLSDTTGDLAANTTITAYGQPIHVPVNGQSTALTGTYYVYPSQTVASEAMTSAIPGITSLPFSVYQVGMTSQVGTNYSFASMLPSCANTYDIDPVNGSDSNSGSSWSVPRQNISTTLALSGTGMICMVLNDPTSVTPKTVSFTASVAKTLVSFTGSISGTTLTVTGISGGSLYSGLQIAEVSGTTFSGGVTWIYHQLTGTTGGNGTYLINVASTNVSTGVTMNASYNLMSVSAVSSGTIVVGTMIPGNEVVGFGTGTGSTGTYLMAANQSLSSQNFIGQYNVATSLPVYVGATRGWGQASPTRSIYMTTRTGNFAYLIASPSTNWPTWTNYSGNCYYTAVSAGSGTGGMPIDLKYLNGYGMGAAVGMGVPVDSAATCATTPNSWYYDGTTNLYVNAQDGRNLVGDKFMVVPYNEGNIEWLLYSDYSGSTNTNTIALQNVAAITGDILNFQTFATQAGRDIVLLDHFLSQGGNTNNGTNPQGPFDLYQSNNVLGDSWQDCDNIHGSDIGGMIRGVEINVITPHQCGHTTAGNNNSTTQHENDRRVSIGGVFEYNQNRTVADIQTSERWMVGSTVGPSDSIDITSECVQAGNSAQIWLDAVTIVPCYSTGGSDQGTDLQADLANTPLANIFYANMNISGLVTSGSVLSYSP